MDTTGKYQHLADPGKGESDPNREGLNGSRGPVEDIQETTILRVNREVLPYAWNFVLPLLESAKDYYGDYYSEADILHQLLSGSSQLWILARTGAMGDIRCLMLTEWLSFSRNKVLRVNLLAARELGDYVPRMLAAIEEWGIKNGATRIQVVGRKAWVKLLRDIDYQHEATVLVKDMARGEG